MFALRTLSAPVDLLCMDLMYRTSAGQLRGTESGTCMDVCVCVCVSTAQVALPINEGRRYSQEWTEKGRPAKDKKKEESR